MDFRGNAFAVQGQGAYMLLLEQKIHGKNFHTPLKDCKNHEKPSATFLIYSIPFTYNRTKLSLKPFTNDSKTDLCFVFDIFK